jgi:membrane protein
MSDYFAKIREALFHAYAHDVINVAKAAAYSGMLMFFPALLVITTLLSDGRNTHRPRAVCSP